MNDFEFILKDIILNKDVKLTDGDYYNLICALNCASEVFKESDDLQNKRKGRELSMLADKINMC
tara:strand:+ start:1510 stop:1701 length:192 start_codon:yes stop_codon:yes gene_type:complete